MCAQVGGTARRVKRFFGDAKIPGPARAGWPVVVADDEIVWIPGVCRRGAASERSGRPVVRYACERFDGGLSSN
jgi:tRNA(Ile)-lysidine synthase